MRLRPLLLSACCLLGLAAGCANLFGPPAVPSTQPAVITAPTTPLGRVDFYRQGYLVSLKTLTPLIEAGAIKDPNVLATIATAKKQVHDDLELAEAQARAGNVTGFEFLMGRIGAALRTLEDAAAVRAAVVGKGHP